MCLPEFGDCHRELFWIAVPDRNLHAHTRISEQLPLAAEVRLPADLEPALRAIAQADGKNEVAKGAALDQIIEMRLPKNRISRIDRSISKAPSDQRRRSEACDGLERFGKVRQPKSPVHSPKPVRRAFGKVTGRMVHHRLSRARTMAGPLCMKSFFGFNSEAMLPSRN